MGRDKGGDMNKEGYRDETARKAIGNVTKQEKLTEGKIRQMLNHFDYVAGLNGFKIENRIVFRDLQTGREYR